jgi:hypothetical protein
VEAPENLSSRTGMIVLDKTRYALLQERFLSEAFQKKASLIPKYIVGNKDYIGYRKRFETEVHSVPSYF